MRHEFDLRNFPLNRLREYLAEVGGIVDPADDRQVSGEGWHAVIRADEPVYVGSIRVVRDWLIIDGDDRAAPVIEHMRRMTMRGGG